MKNLNARIKKIETLKKEPEEFGFKEFLKKCIDLVGHTPRGLPSTQKGLPPEIEEQERQLFADYPEYAAKFRQWCRDLKNR
jgi:hypothetical protein